MMGFALEKSILQLIFLNYFTVKSFQTKCF